MPEHSGDHEVLSVSYHIGLKHMCIWLHLLLKAVNFCIPLIQKEWQMCYAKSLICTPTYKGKQMSFLSINLETAWTLALQACLYLTVSPSLAIRGVRVDCIMDLMQSALNPKENFLG